MAHVKFVCNIILQPKANVGRPTKLALVYSVSEDSCLLVSPLNVPLYRIFNGIQDDAHSR